MTFQIGNWPRHRGVIFCMLCGGVPRNVSLATGRCVVCETCEATDPDYWDYARCIPYLAGQHPVPLEPAPSDPHGVAYRLETDAHLNFGRLGSPIDGREPWKGVDTLEKAIFVSSIEAFCDKYDVKPPLLYDHYNIDYPTSWMVSRAPSWPILMDIRAHILARVHSGELSFKPNAALKEAARSLGLA